MAGFERFNKRWAESGQIEEVTDNNASLGLVYLGDDPPSAEMHNQLFQWLDEKDNYLFAQIANAVAERTGATMSAGNLNLLRDAIATAATTGKAGIQRNATGTETAALASAERTVTPASLKPLIDSLTLGIANSVPSGGVMAFARSSAPAGWLVANGAAVSRTTYVDLFNAIGTTFGAGNGSSTFNLPNIQGAVVRGWNGGSGGVDSNRAFGSIQQPQNQAHTHTATGTAVPAHTHNFTTSLEGGHTHTNTVGAAGGHTHSASSAAAGNHTHSASSGATGSHAHSGTTSVAGSHIHKMRVQRYSDHSFAGLGGEGNDGFVGHPWNNDPILPAGDHSHSFTTNTVGNHTHTVSVAASGDHTHAITVSAVANHVHTVTINAVADHSHSGTTAAAGGFTPSVSIGQEGGEARMYNIALLYCIKI